MNSKNCLAYCIEFQGRMPEGDKRTAHNVLDIVKKARNEVNIMPEANAVRDAKKWADRTLSAE